MRGSSFYARPSFFCLACFKLHARKQAGGATQPLAPYFSTGNIWHAGAPLHVEVPEQQIPHGLFVADQLLAALSDCCIASVQLPDSLLREHLEPPSPIVPVLECIAPTLTALHGLPLFDLENSAQPRLAAFPCLRALSLCHWRDRRGTLQAAHLPSSLEELAVEERCRSQRDTPAMLLPPVVAFDRLHKLRRITFAGYWGWHLCSRPHGAGRMPVAFPQSLKVCSDIPCTRLACAVGPNGTEYAPVER